MGFTMRYQIQKCIAALALALLSAAWCCAEEIYQQGEATLYNAIDVFALRAPHAPAMGEYFKAINARAAELWKSDAQKRGRDGMIAVALCPGGKYRVWIDLDGKHQAEPTEELMKRLTDVPPPAVRFGPVAFAMHFTLYGGSGKPAPEEHGLPEVWRKAADGEKRELLIPDDILRLVWKEADNPDGWAPSELKPIPGYVVQNLEPLGGEILRPENWHFRRLMNDDALAFQIAKEDISNGGEFETGLTINLVKDVTKKSRVSPSIYAAYFIKDKLKNAELVTRDASRRDGDFLREGILIRENKTLTEKTQPFKIGYTLYANDKTDLLIIMVFGTPESEWDANDEIYTIMMEQVILCKPNQPNAATQPAKTGD